MPIVFIHGFDSSFYTWRHMLSALGNTNRVIAPDLPGFGNSAEPEGKNDFASIVDAVLLFIEHLKIKKCILCGHSYGGLIAQAVLTAEPDKISRIVLISSPASSEDTPKQKIRENLMLYGYYNREAITMEMLKFNKTVQVRTPETLKKSPKFPEVTLSPEAISTPCLLIRGTKDVVVEKNHTDKLMTAFKNSSLWTLENTGHVPQEESPEEVLKTINTFIENQTETLCHTQ
ncbi:MAG: alpha/beta hydrolase [Spirochaetales bacterium]|nr:alpha/beta hydrolase [Spirochaetales bacterium]